MAGSRSKAIAAGIFVISAVVLFAIGLFLIGQRRFLFSRTVDFFAAFDDISGLQTGAPVRVAGYDAGQVIEIRVPNTPHSEFRVRFRVVEKVHPLIRTDSLVSIQTEGIVGAMFLQVDTGSIGAPLAPPEFVLRGREAVSMSTLLQQASDTIREVTKNVGQIEDNVNELLRSASAISHNVEDTLDAVTPDIRRVARNAAEVMADASAISDNIRAGRGTIGKLVTDDQLYRRAVKVAGETQRTMENARQITGNVKDITADLENKNIGEDLSQTLRNLRRTTGQIASFTSGLTGQNAEGPSIRRVISQASEAFNDMSSVMEALKHNFFLRGFFNDRGFYDIDDIPVDRYKEGDVGKGKQQYRFWFHGDDMFTQRESGQIAVSDRGKDLLDNAIARTYGPASHNLVIIEGYATQGTQADQYVSSRERAAAARRYIINRFKLDPNYVGAVAMGKVQVRSQTGQYFDGISVVIFAE